MSFCLIVQERRLRLGAWKKPAQSPREPAAGLNEDPGCPPLPLACPPPHKLFPFVAAPSLGAHLKGAQLGCELVQGTRKKMSLGGGGMRGAGGVFPLAQWSSDADTAHSHPAACPASCSVHPVPSFCLYLLWRWLKTHPWLPAGPEAEVTSLGMEKYSQRPQFISLKI